MNDIMRIEIRRLRAEDIETISRIESESFTTPWSAKDFRDLLARDYCMYLVALADGEIAGCCGLTNICQEGNIDNVVVAERSGYSFIRETGFCVRRDTPGVL